jgi:ADP-heptose:LPS heptosyltransferase
MPGSKWRGKCWPASKYVEALRALASGKDARVPVILGGPNDESARELERLLEGAGIRFKTGVGRWSLGEVAGVLAGSRGYLGNDTGLAHLAEAVGAPAVMVFGPTSPEMGFGPWRAESQAVGTGLWCRPCGKDGRRCYRLKNKYLCMTGLDPEVVARSAARAFEKGQGGS